MKQLERNMWYGVNKCGKILEITDEFMSYSVDTKDKIHVVFNDMDFVKGRFAIKESNKLGLNNLASQLIRAGYYSKN